MCLGTYQVTIWQKAQPKLRCFAISKSAVWLSHLFPSKEAESQHFCENPMLRAFWYIHFGWMGSVPLETHQHCHECWGIGFLIPLIAHSLILSNSAHGSRIKKNPAPHQDMFKIALKIPWVMLRLSH